MTTLERLQAWYAEQRDELWEHSYGIKIESCDNPGWWVHIDLKGTPPENVRSRAPPKMSTTPGFSKARAGWIAGSQAAFGREPEMKPNLKGFLKCSYLGRRHVERSIR